MLEHAIAILGPLVFHCYVLNRVSRAETRVQMKAYFHVAAMQVVPPMAQVVVIEAAANIPQRHLVQAQRVARTALSVLGMEEKC